MSGDQIPSLPGKKRRQMPGVCQLEVGGGGCWSFDLTGTLITSMITDWIGWHDILLPINQTYGKIRETNKPSIENAEKSSSLLNKVHLSACKMMCTVQLQAWRVQLYN